MSEIAAIPLPTSAGHYRVARCRIEAREFVQLAHWIPASVHHCLGARPSCGAGVPSLRAAGACLAGHAAPLCSDSRRSVRHAAMFLSASSSETSTSVSPRTALETSP
jgi:hypothetical protein